MDKCLLIFQFVVVSVFSTVFLVEAGPLRHCLQQMNFGRIYHPFTYFAGEIPLDLFCTKFTEFVICFEDALGFHPSAVPDDFTNHQSPAGLFVLKMLDNMANVSKEICTDGFQLREDYLVHSSCYRDVHSDVSNECYQRSLDTSESFRDLEIERNITFKEREINCMIAAYRIGCLGDAINEKCGNQSLNTFNEIISKFRYFESGLCSSETLKIIRTSFIDSFNMTEARKSVYRDCIV